MLRNKRILKTGALAAAMTVVFAIFAFRAAEWTKGLNSDFIVNGQQTGGTGGSTGGGGTVTKVVPQIAVGAYDDKTHYATIIEIINPNASAITLSGNFYNEDGSPSGLIYATNMPSQPQIIGSFNNLSVAANSILVISAGLSNATTPATGTSNWALVTGSNTITVATFFELRRKGDEVLYSRVGVPASISTMTSFVIPRVREKGSAEGDIETGYALVNTGPVTANITATLIDVNGKTISTLKYSVPKNGHKVGITSSDFNFLTPEGNARQYQYLLFTSDQPAIGAAALAFQGGSLTSFPVDVVK